MSADDANTASVDDVEVQAETTAPRISPGTVVDHFKVSRLIGHGAMGQVYLGRDEQLGRRVALKVIHPRHLRAERGRARFLKEARTTAQFSHPHIVTIYAVGEHQGQPYLAMEYLEGQNLRQRMSEGPSGIDDLRVGLAVAEALAEAHRHGVIHRDLKPENVVIPHDGRPRVLDFGLATAIGDALESDDEVEPSEADRPNRSGTPAYLAPEQWRRGESAPPSDIWALGVILHELVTGKRPFVEQEGALESLALRVSDAEPLLVSDELKALPPSQRTLILACLDKDPEGRPTAEEVAAGLRQLLAPELRSTSREHGGCPFPGLQPFSEAQAPFFFGRDRELDAFLERLRKEPILPVVGPSGAGKSSFVRAGVIPRLRERTSWIVIELRPGTTPYLALGAAIASQHHSALTRSRITISAECEESWPEWDEEQSSQQSGRPSDPRSGVERLAGQLSTSPGILGQQLRRLAEQEQAQVLLFVDQLEELYTLAEDERTCREFMDMLCAAADDPRDPVRLVFTLRDDFLGLLAEGERARQALSKVTVLRSPGPAVLEKILVRPLEAVGYRFQPSELALRMVDAVTGEASSLPLVQFTARLLWEQRDQERRLLTEERYEALGGVEGALAEHADGVLEGMTPAQVKLARELFLRLITPQGTRRVVTRTSILENLGHDGAEVLRRLIQARLISVRRSLTGDDEGAELELAHESLIRGWKQLSRWFDEGREDLAYLAQVSQAAELWEERGRRQEEVWQGEALRDAWRNAGRLREVPPLVQSFLEAGEHQERRLQRRRRGVLVAIVTSLALLALGSTVGALALADMEEEAQDQRARAEEQRQRAEEQGAEALREGARAALLRGDHVQARAMLRAALETTVSPLGQALWWRLSREPLLWQRELSGDIDALAFSPDSTHVAAVCDAPSIFVFRLDDMAQRTLRGHRQKPDDVAFSPDGRFLASTSSAGILRLWDLESDSSEPIAVHEDGDGPLAFAPTGELLVTGHRDGRVRLWSTPSDDNEDSRLLRTFGAGRSSPIAAIAFDNAGERVAVTSMDGGIHLFNVRTGEREMTFRDEGAPALTVAFHPNDGLIATGSSDATVWLWRPGATDEEAVILRHSDGIRDLAFSPDGELLAVGSAAGFVHLWDLETSREVGQTAETDGQVLTLAFSPNGELIATGGTDQTLRIWRRTPSLEAEPDRGHTAAVLGAAFSPDGQTLATGSNDQTVRLWEVSTGAQHRLLRGRPSSRFNGVAYSHNGEQLGAAGADGRVRLWDPVTGRQLRSFVGPPWYITSVAFSPDREILATASFDGAIRVWELGGTDTSRTLYTHDTWATDVTFSPDGRLLASCGNGTVRLWDVRSSRLVRGLEELPGSVHGVSFSPDSRSLAFSMGDEPVQLWDLTSPTATAVGRSGGHIYWLSFHPDGRHLGLPLADQTAQIVDVESSDVEVIRGHDGEVNYVRFSPDGRIAATTSDDGTVRLWDVETGRPTWWAPTLLADPPQIYSQAGWTTVAGSQEASTTRPRWREAIEDARFAVEAPSDALGCLVTFDDQLHIWDLDEDDRIRDVRLSERNAVVALAQGCLTVSADGARLHRRDEEDVVNLADRATAAAPGQEGQVMVATGQEVRFISADTGELIRSTPSGSWVEVMVAVDEEVVLGFGDGGLELLASSSDAGRVAFSFEQLPASAPVSLIEGPQKTLIAGFRNGVVGLWSLENGSLIYRFRLHGPARHLRLIGDHLHVVTELGDRRSVNLGVFRLDECALLHHLWENVPVTWVHGTPQRQPAPAEHRCAR